MTRKAESLVRKLGILATVLLWPYVVLAQSGNAAIICENPARSTEKLAFEIDYDRRIVSPSTVVTAFSAEKIAWRGKTASQDSLYTLDRRTGVLVVSTYWANSAIEIQYNCRRGSAGL